MFRIKKHKESEPLEKRFEDFLIKCKKKVKAENPRIVEILEKFRGSILNASATYDIYAFLPKSHIGTFKCTIRTYREGNSGEYISQDKETHKHMEELIKREFPKGIYHFNWKLR